MSEKHLLSERVGVDFAITMTLISQCDVATRIGGGSSNVTLL